MAFGLAAVGLSAQAFRPKSELPPQLAEIAEDHPIDTSCNEIAGDASTDKHKEQNRQKNNFYVTVSGKGGYVTGEIALMRTIITPLQGLSVHRVAAVTSAGDPAFVPPAERIAVFDNDGTLWTEQPMYFQLAFAIDRVKALAPAHPERKTKEPYASLLKGDLEGVLAGGERATA